MAGFVRGDVVVVPFPFSDLSENKRRPALVVADLTGDDIILCQITSRPISDEYTISLEETDFSEGSLPHPSNIRPNKLFTADSHIIIYKAGIVVPEKLSAVLEVIVSLFQ